MKNEVFLSEEGYIMHIYVGDQTDTTLRQSVAEVKVIADKLRAKGKPIHVLADMTKLGRLSTNARKSTIEVLRTVQYDRIAAFGGPTFINALARLIIYAADKEDKIRLFPTRTEACQWLAAR